MLDVGIYSLAPIATALFIAIVFRRVIAGLFLGTLLAAIMVGQFNIKKTISYISFNLLYQTLLDRDHISIIAFTIIIGGLTGVLIKSNATKAFVVLLANIINNKRKAQIFTSLSGFIIFFDDYSNCLIVGSSMRPVCDNNGVSRAKLAYLVDSTAAPIASIAIISTWIAFQVSLIGDAFKTANVNIHAYSFFLSSIPYNFYALFALASVFIVAIGNRDFGPMLTAEKKSLAKKHHAYRKNGKNDIIDFKHLVLFFLPVLSLIGFTFIFLYLTGIENLSQKSAPFFEILGNADSYSSMLLSSSISLFIAIFISLITGVLNSQELFEGMILGIKEVFGALIILVLAWCLSSALRDLNLSHYLLSIIKGNISLALFPTLVFLVAAIISFVTGTSFGTMAILIPSVMPIILNMTTDNTLYLVTTASVLGGAVFGDHCSILSDTTILSSTGARCDILSHVNTQTPYALLAAFFAITFGTLPISLGVSNLLLIPLGVIGIALVFRVYGKNPQIECGENENILSEIA